MSKNVNSESGQDIWDKFIKGDKEALSSLYFSFFDILLNFGIKYSLDKSLVEDSIQNLFIDLLKNQKKYKPVDNVKFFLLKALRNQILYAQRKTKFLIPLDTISETEFKITYSVENTLISEDTEKMKIAFIKLVTETLTPRQKEALFLKFNCGFKYEQISELMNISVESARTIVYRTLKTIKEKFADSSISNLIFFFLFNSIHKARTKM